jgi:transcriptional regulator with XRE-family HTH domain
MAARKKHNDTADMTPEDFNSTPEACFSRGVQSKFARISGLSRSQINRYAQGTSTIPKHVALLVNLCALAVAYGLPLPGGIGDTGGPSCEPETTEYFKSIKF